jgi:hypothetical protein
VESISSREATLLTVRERVLNELHFDLAIPLDRLNVKFHDDWVILSGRSRLAVSKELRGGGCQEGSGGDWRHE